LLRTLLVSATSLLAACGGTSNTSSHDGGSDGSLAVHDASHEAVAHHDAGEAGADSSVAYPAFAVDYPQIQKNAGVVMATPIVVTITWPGDRNAAQWEAFGDTIGASSYWSATTREYGVGKATSGPSNHVRMNHPLPKSLSYTALDDLVAAAAMEAESGGGGPEAGADGGAPDPVWPKPTRDKSGQDQTIYALFIPSSTSVIDPGSLKSFCNEGGLGYHGVPMTGKTGITYAVILQCQTVDVTEETAAHEYVESATDPTARGYFGFDPDHLAWDLYTGLSGNELADVCQNWQDSYFEDTGSFPYWVQRSWSNTAALLGHAPCAPAPAGPYYGVTTFASQETEVTVNLDKVFGASGAAKTRGFEVTVGTPLTFDVGFFSDAARGPWTIAYDFPAMSPLLEATAYTPVGNGAATVEIDKTSGQNGDKATVTVTVTKKGDLGFHLMAITWDPSTMGYMPHYLPIVLVDK
jgi:hypothetical protein